MKKIFIMFGAAALLASCAEENEPAAPLTEPRTFRVSTEETRVHLAQNGGAIQTVWTKGDAVSVFDGTTDNQKFNYAGEEGVAGQLVAETATPSLTGTALDCIYAAYPYAEGLFYDVKNGFPGLNFDVPEVQHYRPGSFGVGANLMIAREEPNATTLHFQNLCSYLALRVTGNRTISKITLTRNDGKPLAGPFDGYHRTDITGIPFGRYNLDRGEGSPTLTLDCGEGVALNENEPTEFIFAIPVEDAENKPMSLGTITVKLYDTEGGMMTQISSNNIAVSRNTLHYMAPLVYKAAQGSLEQVQDSYAIGDYYNKDGLEGIVVWVDASGQHGLITSLDETGNLCWGTPMNFFNTPDQKDGAKNMETFLAWAASTGTTDYSSIMNTWKAFGWCYNKGENWYLPAVDEWKAVLGNGQLEGLNALIANIPGATPFNYYYYWTSTSNDYDKTNDPSTAYRFDTHFGRAALYDKWYPGNDESADTYIETGVRAFAKF